ncbi:MAG: S-layer homology domain-containing protein [Clostridia bacterium]|nr:S-layer homology domain-containing protein [Clostridia bacterium]
MKNKVRVRSLLCILLIIALVIPGVGASARIGDSGYEGGISSGEAPGKIVYEYQEVCFLSGEPIVFKGDLRIVKSMKQDSITTTYGYTLKNLDKSATLSRSLVYSTKVSNKESGQKIEETTLSKFSEVVKIDKNTYTLKNYDFSRSNIVDQRPAINYYAGDIWGRKTYQTGTGTNVGTITVDITGSFYGYDQYWGTTEVETLNYMLQSEQKKGQEVDKWGGTASVTLSSTTTKQLKYVENKPGSMSFNGGYIQTQYNNSILEYSCRLPEFDKNGVSTDKMLDKKSSLKLETFPVQTRLPVPNLKHLRGHWAENNINILYSLEVFKGNDSSFNPEQYMTRAEFAAAIAAAAKEVPLDPALVPKSTGSSSSKKTTKEKPVSPFKDVAVESTYFSQIESVYKRGIMSGKAGNNFAPNEVITVADAITVFIGALGLQGLAPNPAPVLQYKDNDRIPAYSRNALYVADKIGLIPDDKKGYLNPTDKVTKARAAILLNSFISYMRDGIRKDYRERIVNY